MSHSCGKRAVSLYVCLEQVVHVGVYCECEWRPFRRLENCRLWDPKRQQTNALGKWLKPTNVKVAYFWFIRKKNPKHSTCNNMFHVSLNQICHILHPLLRRTIKSACDFLSPSDVKWLCASRSHDSLRLTHVSKQIVNRFPPNLVLCPGVAVHWLCLPLYIPPSAC